MLHASRPPLLLAAMLLALSAGSALAQSRPLGGGTPSDDQPADTAATIRQMLGGCPIDELRAAWGETDVFEGVAVNEEVLRICTGWADDITRVVTAHREAEAAVAALLAPAEQAVPADRPAPAERTAPAFTADADIADSDRAAPAEAPGLAALQSEVNVLRARVETLEAQPGGSPDLEATRIALAEAEARLAAAKQLEQLEREAAQGAAPVSEAVRDAMAEPSQAEPGPRGPDPAQDRRAQGTPPVSEAVTETPEPNAVDRRPNDGGLAGDDDWKTAVESSGDIAPDYDSGDDPGDGPAPDRPEGSGTPVDFAGLLAQFLPGVVSGVDGSVALPEETLNWTLIYTARAGEGPWAAQVLGEGSRAVLLPPLTEDGEPRIEWQSYTRGPFILRDGDALPGDPDGRIVTEITRDGVTVRPEFAPELEEAEAPVPLPWHQGGDPNAPGRADWIVTKIEGAGLEAAE